MTLTDYSNDTLLSSQKSQKFKAKTVSIFITGLPCAMVVVLHAALGRYHPPHFPAHSNQFLKDAILSPENANESVFSQK